MSSLKKLETIVGITNQRAIEVRAECLRLAIAVNLHDEKAIELAKKYEAWIWGGHAPIEHFATPLNTIEEAAEATQARVQEVIDGTEDQVKKDNLRLALATWERFSAELHFALLEVK